MWGPVPPPPPGWTWESLMDRALGLAEANGALGEIPVAAVVVAADGAIVGEAANAPVRGDDPTAHAEILALRAAGQKLGNYRLEGCSMVVTLEPCLMCAGALAHARLDGLVYGAADVKAGAVASCLHGLDLPLHTHRVWHMGGVRAEACADLLRAFFFIRRDS
jgi:Cytosine/adenosine deaminases